MTKATTETTKVATKTASKAPAKAATKTAVTAEAKTAKKVTATATAKTGKTLKVTQIKSLIGTKQSHRDTIRGLGLRRINHTVQLEDTPCVRGMINKVFYMVKCEA
jgi:large subunit ribosomal protein L30